LYVIFRILALTVEGRRTGPRVEAENAQSHSRFLFWRTELVSLSLFPCVCAAREIALSLCALRGWVEPDQLLPYFSPRYPSLYMELANAPRTGDRRYFKMALRAAYEEWNRIVFAL
jgi:hypothetical protein